MMAVNENLRSCLVFVSQIESFIQKIEENKIESKFVHFCFFIEDITHNNGEKILNLLNKFPFLEVTHSVPMCFFKQEQINEYLLRKLYKTKPFFFRDTPGYKQIKSLEDAQFFEKSRQCVNFNPLDKCKKCIYFEKECGGIYASNETKFFDTVFSYIKNSKCKVLLDLGCGLNPLLDYYVKGAKSSGLKVVCVDPSKILISNFIKKCNKTNIFTICGYGENLPLKNGMFDFVICLYSYSHFSNLGKTLLNINRSLKKDGLLFVIDHKHKINKDGDMESRTFRSHNLNECVFNLKKHGFEIIKKFYRDDSWYVLSKKAKLDNIF